MLVFVLVNAAQIGTVREIRNVAVTAVVVSAVLLYDKVNTDFFSFFLLWHSKLILLCNTFSGDPGLVVNPEIKLHFLIINYYGILGRVFLNTDELK